MRFDLKKGKLPVASVLNIMVSVLSATVVCIRSCYVRQSFACVVTCDVLFAGQDGLPTIRPTERVCVQKLTCRYSIAVVMSRSSWLLS